MAGKRCEYINYYRLEAYWQKHIDTKSVGAGLRFFPGTYWEDVVTRYMFDRMLRQVTFDSVARIEVALRTCVAHLWAEEVGSDFPHRRSNNYSPSFDVNDFLSSVNKYYKNSTAKDAAHYRKLYTDARSLPVGLYVEFTSFGNMNNLIALGFKKGSGIIGGIAAEMGMSKDPHFFLFGLAMLKNIRNSCAHQTRIWNRRWLSKNNHFIMRNGKDPLWGYRWDSMAKRWTSTGRGEELLRGLDTTAAALTFCNQLMKVIAPHSQWRERLVKLFTSPDETPKRAYKGVGFTNPCWMEHPLWK